MERVRPILALSFLLGCAHVGAAAAPSATSAPEPRSHDCGPAIGGFDAFARAPVVMLGEVHGQAGPPAFALDFACRIATASGGAILALELPKKEQPRIATFLASNGDSAARAALLAGAFWTREYQDGRSSSAMVELLEKARRLVSGGLPLEVVAIDGEEQGQTVRDQALADALVGLSRSRKRPVIMLVGNLHARTVAGAPWDPSFRFMGSYVKSAVPDALGLDVRYGKGESWVCLSAEASECGRSPTPGSPDSGTAWTVTRFASSNENGFAGTFSVGPAEASEPARGLSPAQAAARIAAEFRAANKPRFVDGAPAESTLGADERRTWCGRLVPLARARLALAGDRIEGDECAATLTPDPARQAVPDVRVRFDVGFFFAKPYAAASYDRASRTLFLPLAALSRPWNEVEATRHEWLHAQHHALARRGDEPASALQTTIRGADYRPDGFEVDEVPVNLCDVLRAAERDRPPRTDQLDMLAMYIGLLRKELDVMQKAKPAAASQRSGVTGHAIPGGAERWLGGADPRRSLAILEGVWKDATTALTALRATPPDIATAKATPLVAGGICTLPARD